MPLFTAEGTAFSVSTLEGVRSFISDIFTAIVTLLGSLYTTITETPLLFITIVVSFAGGLLIFAVGILRRLGVGSGGRRKRRR